MANTVWRAVGDTIMTAASNPPTVEYNRAHRELIIALRGSPMPPDLQAMTVDMASHAVEEAFKALTRVVRSAPDNVQSAITMAAIGLLVARGNDHMGAISRIIDAD